jgi:hypothetical protein
MEPTHHVSVMLPPAHQLATHQQQCTLHIYIRVAIVCMPACVAHASLGCVDVTHGASAVVMHRKAADLDAAGKQ